MALTLLKSRTPTFQHRLEFDYQGSRAKFFQVIARVLTEPCFSKIWFLIMFSI